MNTDECDAIDLIVLLEDGAPDAGVRRHVAGCDACRTRLAQYRKLLDALLQARREAPDECPERRRTAAAAVGAARPDRRHLGRCRSCRILAEDISYALDQIERRTAVSAVPLPDGLKKRVATRKSEWQADRFDKVLDLTEVTDRRKRESAKRSFFDQSGDDLPKAAFPDDLTGSRKSDAGDEETDD
jgi:hypothetical protein